MAKVGRPIDVGDVVSKSTNLLRSHPVLFVPQAIVLVLSLLEAAVGATTFSLVNLLLVLISLIVSIIVTGAYPSMVQAVLEGRQPSVSHSFGQAYHRFWSLVVAGIVVGVLVLLGFIAFVVPGIILACWYVYTVPAIMLENKGALAGMSASKAFGRDKKWKTFLLLLLFLVISLVVSLISDAFSFSPVAMKVVSSLLGVPVDAWFAVVLTYTYLAYGPSSSPAGVPLGTSVVLQPGTFQPAPTESAAATGARFCPNCGSPIQPGSKFCQSCGKPL